MSSSRSRNGFLPAWWWNTYTYLSLCVCVLRHAAMRVLVPRLADLPTDNRVIDTQPRRLAIRRSLTAERDFRPSLPPAPARLTQHIADIRCVVDATHTNGCCGRHAATRTSLLCVCVCVCVVHAMDLTTLPNRLN